MSLSVENVMQDLEPVLRRGRPQKPGCRCPCGQTDPAMFGSNRHSCLPCGRDRAARAKLAQQQEAAFKRAMETLKLINSFPTKEALCR